jgi:hypothetical protein
VDHNVLLMKNLLQADSFYVKYSYILSLTYSFSWYPLHVLPIELWEPRCKSSSLPVDRKYQKGQSRDLSIFLVLSRIHINFIFYDTALILCLSFRKIILIHRCLYFELSNKFFKIYMYIYIKH